MNEIKRIVGLVLCFVMVFGLLPVHAFAAETEAPLTQVEENAVIADDAQEGTVAPLADNEGSGNLLGGAYYELDTNGVDAGETYLIVSASSVSAYALRNNDGSSGRQSVTIANNRIETGFINESYSTWTFTASGTSWYISNSATNTTQRIRLNENDILSESGNALTVSSESGGAYRISYRSYGTTYYLRYTGNNAYNSSWQRNTSSGNVYLFKKVAAEGTAVDFRVTPANSELKPGEDVQLNPVITLANGTDVDSYDITWESSADSIATVTDDGFVEAVTDGTATITATLNKVNDRGLARAIEVKVTIKVTTRTVEGYELTGNTPIITKKGAEPDFSNIKLIVTYNEGAPVEYTAEHGLVFGKYNIDVPGTYEATISHDGVQYGTVRVIVEGNPYEGLDEATDYPKYPEDGAVRIDKFATELDFADTGLVQVELDVAGVSVKQAVDVLLIMDISNSMSWDDSEYDYADTAVSLGTNQRLNIARDSAKEFMNSLLAENSEAGNLKSDNSVTVLAFAGIDGDYNTHSTAKQNDDVYQIGDLTLTTIADANAALDKLVKATTGGTNYDYAFQQAHKIAGEIHEERGNDVYIVFMTDGVPTHYNGVYYKSRNNTDLTACMQYVDPTTGQTSSYTSTGNDRNGNDIDYTAKKDITVHYNDGTTATKNVTYNKGWSDYVTGNKNGWAEKVKALDYVANVYAIGFGMKNGSVTQGAEDYMPTLRNVYGGTYYIPSDVTHTTLQHIASNANSHFEADNLEEMSNLYKQLATQIKFAGTQANVSDVIDSDFTLQMGNTTGTEGQGIGKVTLPEKYTPTITIKTYDLYTKDETTDTTLIGTRKGTSQVIETVTFNDAGTEAYIRTGSGTEDDPYVYSENIMTTVDGTVTIVANYFTYTKTPEGVETFKWNIGNITDKEIALSYYAYLKGSMEGKEPDGLKYTNKEATLEYIDINGDHATQIFPVPAVAWGGASTAYEFYLVNNDGKPCDRLGNEIPFANRIIITGPYFEALYLNQGEQEIAKEIVAVKVLPAGYTLYDETAMYTVQTSSSTTKPGSLTISDPADGKEQTTIVVSAVTPSYIQSRVAFGVMYNDLPSDPGFVIAPDKVVIDYGKEIIIDVNSNNSGIDPAYKAELLGFSKFYDDVDVKQWFNNTVHSTPFEGTYGTFTLIEEGENKDKVSYVPHKMVNSVGKVFCVYQLTNKTNEDDVYYMVSELDVIPATVVYYETDFADWYELDSDNTVPEKVFKLTGFGENQKDTVAADGPQNDGTIGQNTYGFDTTYDDDTKLSNGSSLFAQGAGVETTKATFSFTGTGFDLISRTGVEQGLIKVEVFTDSLMSNKVRTVSVLNKSASDLELYQIPVVSIDDLDHGTYYVKVGVEVGYTPSNPALSALYRGNEFYFDAIRVYNPAEGNAVAKSAYNDDGEANATLTEVRQELIGAETFNAITKSTDGMVYVDSTYTDEMPDGRPGNVLVADYAKIGPNNEVYLSKGQAIAFKVKTTSTPASFDIGAKSIKGETAHLEVTVRNAAGTTDWSVEKDITSSTVQFIDLLPRDVNGVNKDLLRSDDAYVVITNTGDGVLSITDLKVGYTVGAISLDEAFDPYGLTTMGLNSYDPFAVSYTVDASALEVARMVLTAPETPVEPEEPEIPETPEEPDEPEIDTSIYNIMNANAKVNGSKKNQKCTFTVVTLADVEQIQILQNSTVLKPTKITFKDGKNGIRTWTIVLTGNGFDGKGTFILTGIGENGLRGESVEVMDRKAH